MGLARFVNKQFIDVIQWTEEGDDVLAWRFPTADLEIQQGAALIVRDTQTAVFVDEGRIADRFEGGRYVLRTKNLPVLTDLRHWTKLFESPFKSEVYFFSTRLRVGQTFGTPQPDHRPRPRVRRGAGARLRRLQLPHRRRRPLPPAGVRARATSTASPTSKGSCARVLASALAAAARRGRRAVPRHGGEPAGARRPASASGRTRDCAPLGLAITDVKIESLTLPDELQQRLDERIGMSVVGDLGRYTQFQTARSIPLAAAAEGGGGAAGAGVGVGAGVAMGQAMAQAMAPGAAPRRRRPRRGRRRGAAAATCPHCQATLERATRFCPECGQRP